MAKTTTYDFQDGAGPVPAHQHVNPDGSTGGWVAETAHVASTAYLGPLALVFGSARVYDSAQVFNSAWVFDSARVLGSARVYDSAWVFDSARVFGSARVFDSARVSRTPLVLTGLEYPVIVADNLVGVGCQWLSLEEWAAGATPEPCPRLEAVREVLVTLARLHQEQV